jgi:cytochrome c553
VKLFYFYLPSVATLLAVAVLAVAQTPATPPNATALPPAEARVYPTPTNLKVLPKNLTGEQLHEIMEQWSAALDTHCDSCHTADTQNIGPNGRPRLNFADDSKPMKDVARLMFKMTEDINTNYVSMIDSSGAPVTCGTCHRGHIGPEPFKIQPPNGPPTAQLPPSGEARPPAQ